MNRQQRRKLEREKKKKLICSFQSAKNVGWTESEFDNDVLNDDSISSEQIIAPYVCTPTTDKQEFEMTMREFGEAIQQSDTVIPPPRFEYIIIIKPHP
ncbi:hypothetical protein F4212_01455, partial [Candidatus Poribacteria bacterium]|nr:hypothetical protein [Candidatus Poribacteria bacterium]